ncbi:hypothetical protein Tco_0774976 [Tanacetum coccineum]|uniref:Uncharacterized protein n=1 Tax=Tanacetum coccineum TaxID=301880 RepID=A0ABQ4ZQ01_9ASTR
MELQQMQQEVRKLHSKCMERFKILMSHLSFGDTQLNYGFTLAFKRYFGEVHETFCQKMFQNVNELQWKLEKYNLHECDPKNCLSFKNSTGTDPQTFKERLHEYLDGLDKTQESLVIKGATLEVNLVTEGVALEESLVTKDAEKILVDTVASDIEYADIRPSFDSDIVYENNENNSDIVFDIPNMDPDRGKEEHDYVDYEQQRAFFASLINNLKCDVKKYTKGLGFENKNDVENPSLLNKVKELAPSLYNINEMEKDLHSDHKIIYEQELKCKVEKCLKVKQRISPLSYHGFVYGETQFEEPPKVPLKRRNVNLKKHLEQTQNLKEHLEQAQLRNYDPKL